MVETGTDLSITIVSYNTPALLRQCLRSIRDHTRTISFEVWVVDNDSIDDSAEMVAQEFPDVHLIRNKDNKGLAAATNQGLEKSAGRYVMALNSDTVMMPDTLDKLVKFMDQHPDVGAATPRLVLPDGGSHPMFVGNTPTPMIELKCALAPLSRSLELAAPANRFGKETNLTHTQEASCILWGTALIVRREILDTVGHQDPRFFVYAEDVDWVMRIAKAGWKLYYVADAEVVHYGGQSTRQASAKMLAMMYKNKSRLIQKHYGFTAGLMLRSAYASVWGIRILKWLFLYVFSGRRRSEAGDKIDRMWRIVCSVVTY